MRYYLEDAAFDRMYEYLQSERKIHTGDKKKIRIFMEAMYWMARSGAQWRLLPEEYGYWNTVYRRFDDWSRKGVFKRMFHYFSKDSDMEWLMIDSTIVRAHACSVGAKGGKNFRRWAGVREAIAQRYT